MAHCAEFLSALLFAAVTIVATGIADATARPAWLACTAWAGSHTGRYTFLVDARACSVFWKEVDRTLKVDVCNGERIVALKPFAPNPGFVVAFNLKSGSFADYANGRADRGSCKPLPHGAKHRSNPD